MSGVWEIWPGSRQISLSATWIKFDIKDITRVIISYVIWVWNDHVRFCLSYGVLDTILLPSKCVYFNENLHCCNERRDDITCSRRKCYVTYGHYISYAITLSSE